MVDNITYLSSPEKISKAFLTRPTQLEKSCPQGDGQKGWVRWQALGNGARLSCAQQLVLTVSDRTFFANRAGWWTMIKTNNGLPSSIQLNYDSKDFQMLGMDADGSRLNSNGVVPRHSCPVCHESQRYPIYDPPLSIGESWYFSTMPLLLLLLSYCVMFL